MTADWHREGSVDQQAGRAQVQLTLTGPKGSGVLYANLLKWPVEEGGDKVWQVLTRVPAYVVAHAASWFRFSC
jgi:hypothetical protein